MGSAYLTGPDSSRCEEVLGRPRAAIPAATASPAIRPKISALARSTPSVQLWGKATLPSPLAKSKVRVASGAARHTLIVAIKPDASREVPANPSAAAAPQPHSTLAPHGAP